jgi:hypothetical protein
MRAARIAGAATAAIATVAIDGGQVVAAAQQQRGRADEGNAQRNLRQNKTLLEL